MPRARNGISEYVKFEQRLVLLAWLNSLFGYENNRDLLADVKGTGEVSERWGNVHASIVPYQTFQAVDDYLILAWASTPTRFSLVCLRWMTAPLQSCTGMGLCEKHGGGNSMQKWMPLIMAMIALSGVALGFSRSRGDGDDS